MAVFYPPPEPRQRDRRAAILLQTGESQPPRRSPITAQNLTAIAAWWVAAAVPMPVQKQLTVAPLTLTYGQQPPINGPITPQETTILGIYPAAGEPRLMKPNDSLVKIAPLTLTYGQQPPIAGPITPAELSVVRNAWEPVPLWTPPPLRPTAGWNFVPVVPVYVPYMPLSASIPIAWVPPPPLPARPVGIAPLTLAVGDQPPTTAGLTPTELAIILGSWPDFGEPRLAVQPQVVARYIAPLTLTYGQQPPNPPLTAAELSIIRGAWPELGEPRLPIQPQIKARYIAPLTLRYGSQPPPSGPISVVEWSIIRGAWEPVPLWKPPGLVLKVQGLIVPVVLSVIGHFYAVHLRVRNIDPMGDVVNKDPMGDVVNKDPMGDVINLHVWADDE